jgi:hypothetical protein
MFFKQYKYSKKVLSIQALFALSFNKIHVLCTVFAGRGDIQTTGLMICRSFVADDIQFLRNW